MVAQAHTAIVHHGSLYAPINGYGKVN